MKVLFFVLITFFNMNSCSSEKTSQEMQKYFDKITCQKWVGGVKGAGGGTILNIMLLKSLPSNVELMKVHFQEREGILTKVTDLHYQASIRTFENKFETEPTPTIKTDLKPNQAKIFFKIDDKESSILIDNVKELPMLAYPSAKPRN
jgi:hypothetical protein